MWVVGVAHMVCKLAIPLNDPAAAPENRLMSSELHALQHRENKSEAEVFLRAAK